MPISTTLISTTWIHGGMTGVTSHPPESTEKYCVIFRSTFFVLSIFKLKSDAKYKSIPSEFKCVNKYI